jgi:hypothetical protein
MMRPTFAAIAAVVLAARLCHRDVLWVEEAYGMAAARELLRGESLYRDIWFDKPPLYAWIYTLWGALPGVPHRVAGTIFVLLCAAMAWRFARDLWGEREGLIAAALLAFFLTFGIPSAVMALAPDLLLVPLHLAAVWLAWRGRALAAGVLCGVGLAVNTKAVFVVAACCLFASWWRVTAAFAAVAAVQFLVLPREWIEQVWVWGAAYSRDSHLPWTEGVVRTLNWAGFHAVLIIAAVRVRDRRLWLWALLSFAAVVAGFRFFPRYYFALLPPFVILASRGLILLSHRWRAALLLLLVIPLLRFGPRYVQLAMGDRSWSDLAMNRDSREAGEWLKRHSAAGDQLFVWGYRPDIFIYSGLPAGTRYLDSQPLTGVLADRHLSSSVPTFRPLPPPSPLPEFVADGLGPYNPALAAGKYLDLRHYRPVHRTAGTIIYSRQAAASQGTR